MNFGHCEALYWNGRLGSFHAAAQHLHTSQAARRAPHLDYVLAYADASLSPPAHHVATAAQALIKQQPDLDAYFAAASIADR